MEWLGLLPTRPLFKPADESVDVPQDPKVPDQPILESEDRGPIPPDVTTSRLDVEELALVIAMETQLSKNLIPLFREGKDIGRVVVERISNELHIAYELLMANQLRTQRATEREVRMEDLRHQGSVRVIPHFLVENPYEFLLA